MDSFAEYILSEKDFIKKLEIVYYLQKRENIFFDTSVVFKAKLAEMFIDTMNLKVDKNLVLTAMMLYACKKTKDATDINKVRSYTVEGAEYLATLGFSKRFCKICREANRYNDDGNVEREIESDILELIDSFGGLVLDRPERKGFPIDEAVVLTEHRNLKGYNNKFVELFKEFIYIKEGVRV